MRRQAAHHGRRRAGSRQRPWATLDGGGATMGKTALLAVGGGGLSGAAVLLALAGSPLGIMLVYLAPLPLLVVGLGFGSSAFGFAAAAGMAVALAFGGGFTVAGLFGGMHVIPSWLIVQQALR